MVRARRRYTHPPARLLAQLFALSLLPLLSLPLVTHPTQCSKTRLPAARNRLTNLLPACLTLPSGATLVRKVRSMVHPIHNNGPHPLGPPPLESEISHRASSMASTSLGDIASSLLAKDGLELVSCRATQSLWAGYGHICQVEAVRRSGDDKQHRLPLILKYISPPPTANTHDEGHIRKILSYHVEQYFYNSLASQLPESVAVARCIASTSDGQTTAVLLRDLREPCPLSGSSLAFPVSLGKRGQLSSTQVFAALDWLAGFHGHFWGKTSAFPRDALLRPPLVEVQRRRGGTSADPTDGKSPLLCATSVWLNGGYTYLATRQREYDDLANDTETAWSEILCRSSRPGEPPLAERMASLLSPVSDPGGSGPIAAYETLIHGDVKSENMFASESGHRVAFFDFQYVGLGLGVCDLAKLFTCSVPLSMLEGHDAGTLPGSKLNMDRGEEELLRYYHHRLEEVSNKTYPWDVFLGHWEVALVDWLRFQASWGFWGNTDWLEARVRRIADRYR